MSAVITRLLFGILCGVGINAQASVNCIGIPETVKMGDIGLASDGYMIVNIGGKDYRLGAPENEATKARTALVLAGFAANKKIMLRFYDPYNDCAVASSQNAVPISVQLLQ